MSEVFQTQNLLIPHKNIYNTQYTKKLKKQSKPILLNNHVWSLTLDLVAKKFQNSTGAFHQSVSFVCKINYVSNVTTQTFYIPLERGGC